MGAKPLTVITIVGLGIIGLVIWVLAYRFRPKQARHACGVVGHPMGRR